MDFTSLHYPFSFVRPASATKPHMRGEQRSRVPSHPLSMAVLKKKILIIGPDPQLAATRCLILQSHGYHALCISNSHELLASWVPRTYDLVLVDVQHNADLALQFCNELKEKDIAQLVALMSDHHVWVPPHPCPDEVISRSEGPERFVQKIRRLLDHQT